MWAENGGRKRSKAKEKPHASSLGMVLAAQVIQYILITCILRLNTLFTGTHC